MGTNYYLLIDPCDKCHRPAERLHIGKNSAGWTFAFRAHPDREIKSFEDWKKVLVRPNQIEDEYGFLVSYTEFFLLVESQRKAKHNHALSVGGPYGDWVDAEGNSFSPGEFS